LAFKGFPAEAFDFYEGLEADNTKAYWTDHKSTYETCVRAPMDALLEELAGEFGPGKVFRPYRDVRFSADKSPYKTACGAVSVLEGSVFYVQISADGLLAASGYYQMAKDQIERYRLAVAEPAGKELAEIVDALEKDRFEIGGEALKRVPRGFDPDHPRARLLRHKGVTAHRHFTPAAWMGTAKAKERVASAWRAAGPLNAWLRAHVGPSLEAADPRG
jgi:uncharacterized protein (TIGR02453 family)